MSVQRNQAAEGVCWRVRWREDGGRMRSRTLATKKEALTFDADVRARRFRAEAPPQPGRLRGRSSRTAALSGNAGLASRDG